MLTVEQQRLLLELARRSLVQQVHAGRRYEVADDPPDLPIASGVFVTVKAHGELRGCLGTLNCCATLDREVVRCAADAASEDPRFAPVSEEELPDVRIEISVLHPLEPIDPFGPAAFSIGRHGLVVEEGHRRGLLLPQVAVEWGWTPEQFLSQTCVKAGLPPKAWRSGAAVFRFDAEVFGE